MSSAHAFRNGLVFLMFIGLLSGAGCGGGDEDYSIAFCNDNTGDGSFCIQGIFFGRPLVDASGMVLDVVNPLSVIETHPLTGELLEGYPRALHPEEPLDRLSPLFQNGLPIDPVQPPGIPRDAALVIQFSRPVDPACLFLDARSRLTKESPIRVLTAGDDPLPLQALARGTRVILNPVTKDTAGFPRAPVQADRDGHPEAAGLESAFKLAVRSEGMGQNAVRSLDGVPLAARADLLGSPCKPFRFIAGAGAAGLGEGGGLALSGYLPDLSPPRIIREVGDQGTAGAGSGAFVIEDPSKNFVILANNGLGEWAGGLLTLRPGQPDEERVWVVYNTTTALHVAGGFSKLPVPGVDAYRVQRAELFEPIPGFDDPATAVDPKNHPKDPFDPEDQKNWALYNFALFDEWNEAAKAWEPVDYDPGPNGTNPIDPNWRISFRFSEAMAPASFRPYETFYVCDGDTGAANPGFGLMKTGRVTVHDQRRIIAFEPVLEDRSGAGEDRLLGFGGHPKNLRLVLRVIPSADVLDWFYQCLGPPANWPPEVVDDLVAAGVLGIVSASGQPLGLPYQFHDILSPYCVIHRDSPGRGPFPPAVDLKYGFNTARTGDPETGALVHRFMGLPEIGVGPGTDPITGVIYNDHEGAIYGPHIADAGLDANGFLTGHPVEFIEHVFDDYNHPPPSSPFYPDPIFKIPFGVGTPITAQDGCRFQHVYRSGDCSPEVPAFKDTVLDLIGLAWAPIGGMVTNGLIEKMAIAVGDSHVIPDTRQEAGIPHSPNSGLTSMFDNNYKTGEKVVVGKDRPGGPNVGVPYVIDYKNLYAPKNAGPKFNYYLSWPAFRSDEGPPGFGYDSILSLLIEYRLDRNEKPLPPSNGFSFHAGIISSMLPRFRIFSRGDILKPVNAASYPERYPSAWGPLPSPGNYGDNSRYFMIFNYVKRLSRLESFFLGPDAGPGAKVDFLTPLVDPLGGMVPEGADLHVTFQAALDPSVPNGPLSPWVEAEEVERLNQNSYADFDHLRFRAIFEADVPNAAVPAIDTVVIPYLVK